MTHVKSCLAAFTGGALGVLGFAPFHFWPAAIASIAVLFALWLRPSRKRGGFAIGFLWGLGLFLAGVSWIYVSLHVYGNRPAILAALATLLFCAYLSLFPAMGGVVVQWMRNRAASASTPTRCPRAARPPMSCTAASPPPSIAWSASTPASASSS